VSAKTDILLDWQEYYDLKEDRRLLRALRVAGVDNWEGYDEAMTAFLEGSE
jgi:hypothetical protein